MPSTLHLNVNMKSTVPPMTIGELAARFGLATHVLRHWEAMGLLEPARLANGRRVYGSEDAVRVAMIVHAREVGLGLEQIRDLLTRPDGAGRRETLRAHRDDLLRRIAWAQASVELVDHALACPHEDFLRCPDFRRLAETLAGV
jgi:MerR family copper efflux transcriptional regulator